MDKKDVLETFAIQKSPVKIKKFGISKKFGTEDVVIGNDTILSPTAVDFDYTELNTDMTVGSLNQVATNELVKIKGKIAQLAGIKTLNLAGLPVKKQEAVIVDPTGFMKVILWGMHVDSVREGGTYVFDKLRVKVSKGERYLNTPKIEDLCVISEAHAFEEKLPHVDNVASSKTVSGEIIGIFHMEKYLACKTCSKKVLKEEDVLAYCDRCKVTTKLSRCLPNWLIKVHVETCADPPEMFKLTMYQDVVNKIFLIHDIDAAIEPKELTTKLLSMEPMLFSFDNNNYTIFEIETIDI